jgi:hypothetical protein
MRDPRSGKNISGHISESLEQYFGLKYLNSLSILCCGCPSGTEKTRSGMEKSRSGMEESRSRIRDGKIKIRGKQKQKVHEQNQR